MKPASGTRLLAATGLAAFLVAHTISAPAKSSGSPVIPYTRTTGGIPHIWTMNVDKHTRGQLTHGRYGEEAGTARRRRRGHLTAGS